MLNDSGGMIGMKCTINDNATTIQIITIINRYAHIAFTERRWKIK